MYTPLETSQPVVFGSETGSCSDTGSQTSVRRNPMRGVRSKSTTSSSAEDNPMDDNYESDESEINRRNGRPKGKRNGKGKQKTTLSSRNRALGRRRMLSPLPSISTANPMLSSGSTSSQSNHHPLFLDMLKRRQMDGDSVSPFLTHEHIS
jgi:hypothetical protein